MGDGDYGLRDYRTTGPPDYASLLSACPESSETPPGFGVRPLPRRFPCYSSRQPHRSHQVAERGLSHSAARGRIPSRLDCSPFPVCHRTRCGLGQAALLSCAGASHRRQVLECARCRGAFHATPVATSAAHTILCSIIQSESSAAASHSKTLARRRMPPILCCFFLRPLLFALTAPTSDLRPPTSED